MSELGNVGKPKSKNHLKHRHKKKHVLTKRKKHYQTTPNVIKKKNPVIFRKKETESNSTQ